MKTKNQPSKSVKNLDNLVAILTDRNILKEHELIRVRGGEGEGVGTSPTPPPVKP